jgi:hypothetical protein
MQIEINTKTITLTSQELLEQYPDLAMMINSSSAKQKRSYRKKKKLTVGHLIDKIIDDLNDPA